MNNSKNSKITKAVETIHLLFFDPPVSLQEFQQRIKNIDPAAGRAVLLQMLHERASIDLPREPVVLLAQEFNLGDDPGPLMTLIQDETIDEAQRTLALMVLAGTNPGVLDPASFPLSDTLLESLAQNSHEVLMGAAIRDVQGAEEFTKLLLDVEPQDRDDAFDRLEEGRRGLMVPAWLLFEDALQADELQSLHPVMVDFIDQEIRVTGVDVWDDLLQLNLPRQTRSLIQAQLMRWRTSILNPTSKEKAAPFFTAPATAWICPCDGVGAFIILIKVQLDRDRISIHNICLRTTGELRDGFVLPFVTQDDFEEMLVVFEEEQDQRFVRFPLDAAFELVSQARVSPLNDQGKTMEDNLRAASVMQWVAAMAEGDEEDNRLAAMSFPRPAHGFSPADLFELFAHPDLVHWFLNAEELRGLGVDAVAPLEMEERWQEEQVNKVNIAPTRDALRGLLLHLAWVHAWENEPRIAGLCSGAINLLEGEKSAFPVMLHYLMKSFQANRTNEEMRDLPLSFEVGDRGLREELRGLGFPRLTNPKGKHMAILDFSEAAQMVIKEVVGGFSSQRQPRDNILPLIALAMGKAQADMVFSGRSGFDLPEDPKRFQRMINAVVKVSNLDDAEAAELWSKVVPSLESFIQRVCWECSVDCLGRRTGDMREWFYSGEHPGAF